MIRLSATLCIGVFLGVAMTWAPYAHAEESARGYLVFEHNTLERMPSDYVPDATASIDRLSCALARGEHGCVQFGVHARAGELKSIRVAVTSDLDVTVYRRRTDFIVQEAPKPTEADLDKRVAKPSDMMYLQRGDTVAKLAKSASVNFWLKIHAAADAAPGEHLGNVRIEVDGKGATEIALVVNVRPFELAPADIPFGLWHSRGAYTKGYDAPFDWLFRDMVAHGHNSICLNCYRGLGVPDFSKLPIPEDHDLVKVIETAQDAGLLSARFPFFIESSFLYFERREEVTGKLTEDQLRAAIDWLAAQRVKRDWPEFITYGRDEPAVPAPGIRENYGPLRPLPHRVGTAMNAKAAYAHGDIHDIWMVHDGHITPEMQAEATRRGAELWTYTYRLWRQDYHPLIQRHFPGFYTWALKLKGNYIWAYYYAYNWIHPETKETMPTTGWEARREGITDYRYLMMLEDAIAARPNDALAIEAAVWLEKLRARVVSNYNQDPDGYWNVHAGFPVGATRVEPHIVEAGKPFRTDEYDEIRAKAADYIAKLGPASPPLPAPGPIQPMKDEAAAFRGKTAEQCAEGLRSGDTQTRRSAAMALFEMRIHNDDTIDELIKALDDPDVRVPALMALEVIGPAANRAAPKVAALLSYPDDFIRQGAHFALKGLTVVPKKPLVELPKMWAFRKDPDKVGEAQKWFYRAEDKTAEPWTPISTHDFWETGYVGDGWYALDVTIPKTPGKRTWIEFGSVDENYTLWINGLYIGDNTNAGTGFWNVPVEVEITGRYKPDESNHIVVRVNNSAQAGGIWKPVSLFAEK